MALEVAPERPQRTLSDRAGLMVARAREIARSYLQPLQGPYTSILITENGASRLMPVSGQTALAIGAVYRALAVYADLIGTMPVQRLRGDTERLPLPPFVEHPRGLPVGWTDEIGQLLWSLLLRGNAYAIPTSWDAAGFPATFYVHDPDQVDVDTDPASGGVRYRLRRGMAPRDADRVLVNPAPDDLLHIRWQAPPGGWCGIGVLDAAGGPMGSLAGAWWAERYAADVMANPVPPAVLNHPLRLNASQAGELQTQWAESTGRGRAVPAVLSGGITYQALTVTPRDVELIESRRWNATQIATWFGLPAYLVGGSTGDSMTYATVEGEMTRLWATALMPAAVRLERALGAWTPLGQRLKFVPDVLLRSQTLDRYQAHRIALDPAAPFLSVDEVRALENRPPMPAPEPPAPPAPLELPAAPPALEVNNG